MKKAVVIIAALALLLTVLIGVAPKAKAAGPLDEILEYRITVDVNEDGTLTLTYHFDWKVLDSSSEGPLEWVKVGIPNSNYLSMRGLSDTVDSVTYYSKSGTYARVDLDRKYYEGEVVSFDFEVVQDYMYQMNYFTEGETYYEFTPGWFDCSVDKLIIKWDSRLVKSVTPACLLKEDGYYTWETALAANDTYTVGVTYENDAYAFDSSKTIEKGFGGGGDYDDGSSCQDLGCDFATGISAVVFFMIVVGVISAIKSAFQAVFKGGSGFSGASSEKKITREKIVYHESCPNCGAPRPEGKDNCAYCGTSFIKSKETVTEEQVPEEVKDKKTDGTYHYGPDPNTYMRVHVVTIPVSRPRSSGGGSTRSGGCAHSSCACAHSCACACACACAGGGRAGCTTKDFYNTGLKLSVLEKKAGAKKAKKQ
ncbi:MAG: zinc ribbon domain-containing protein [Clostridiales bacterium]|nr:zinc ribbon domain-containing protein [Clostridiales bacterium]